MPSIQFQIDVSRRFKNKTGYDHGGKLNYSFRTETHTPDTLRDDVIAGGWPYTMTHLKRSPQATGADKRDCKTPKHIENFVSMQIATFDDDSGEGDVVAFWLNDLFFKAHGWAFVESASSKPGRQKGHPTFIFDQPVTDPALYKEILQSFCTAYPRLDWLVNIDRTIYNGEGAKVHELGNICPLDVFVREIVEPWRAEEARKLAAIEAEQQRQRDEWERLKAQGRTVSGNLEEAWLSGWLGWVIDKVADTRSGGNPSRNGALYWAGRAVAGAMASPWTQPHAHLFADVESRIVQAATVNGYLADYAHGDEREVLRIFERGKAAGGQVLDEPRPTRAVVAQELKQRFDPQPPGDILQQIEHLRHERDVQWMRNPGADAPDVCESVKDIFRHSGQLDKDEIDDVLDAVERGPVPLADKQRTELRKIWQAARRFAKSNGVFVVQPERPDTWPYEIRDGRIMYLTERMLYDVVTVNYQVVADFSARITAEITDEGGERTFVVSGKSVRGGAFRFEMEAQDFGNERKLKGLLDAASGARDPVRAKMSGHLSAALQLLTGEDVKTLTRFKRAGWANGKFLMPGREPPGVLVEIGNKPPYSISGDADLQLGLATLDALLSCAITSERATVVASIVFQAPLAHLAGWNNERYCIFVTGRTGSFKTTFMQALMCVYGPRFADDERLTKWGDGATANALMGLATRARDLPFLVDNFKPGTGGGIKAFVGLIHNMLEGGEKDRMDRNSELRDTKSVFCWPVCTGEDVPDTDAASLARVLVVPFLWQDQTDYPQLSKAQSLTEHLCAVGGAWLDWLESEDGKTAAAVAGARMPDVRREWVQKLGDLRRDSVNKMRVASNLATNQLTWDVMCQHPTIGPVAQRYRHAHRDGLDLVAQSMAEATAEALEAKRYIAAIRELVLTEQVLLPNPNENPREIEKVIGYADSMGCYLLPALARQAAERLLGNRLNDISQNALNRQLDTLGLIESHSKGTLLKSKKVGGKATWVLHLHPGVLDVEDAEEEVIPF